MFKSIRMYCILTVCPVLVDNATSAKEKAQPKVRVLGMQSEKQLMQQRTQEECTATGESERHAEKETPC